MLIFYDNFINLYLTVTVFRQLIYRSQHIRALLKAASFPGGDSQLFPKLPASSELVFGVLKLSYGSDTGIHVTVYCTGLSHLHKTHSKRFFLLFTRKTGDSKPILL